MSVVDQVLASKTPREALLLVAAAIDELKAQAPAADPWASWDVGELAVPPKDGNRAASTRAPRDPNVRTRLGVDADPDVDRTPDHSTRMTYNPSANPKQREVSPAEVKAWIEQNYGTPIDPDDPSAQQIMTLVRRDLERADDAPFTSDDRYVVDLDGIIDIDMAPPNDEYRQMRYEFAKHQLDLDVAFGPHPEGGDWAEDYAKVGPLPYYIQRRELFLDYPDQVKSAMVQDVLNFDEKTGYEMGRDLLKVPMIKDRNNPAMKIGEGDFDVSD